jgi:hypothetical protein
MRYFHIWIDLNKIEVQATSRASALLIAESHELCGLGSYIGILEFFPVIN